MTAHEVVFLELTGESGTESDPLLRCVSPERRQHIGRLAHPEDRHASLYAALLVRWCACRALSVRNDELEFSRTPSGKPYLRDVPAFYFSLSHTRGAVAVAVSSRDIGVDVERLGPARPRVAERCFTAEEQSYIGQSDNPGRAFYEVWTRKEAYLKYTGQGLSVPLQSFCVVGEMDVRIETVEQHGYLLSACEHRNVALPLPLTVLTEREFREKAVSLLLEPDREP